MNKPLRLSELNDYHAFQKTTAALAAYVARVRPVPRKIVRVKAVGRHVVAKTP